MESLLTKSSNCFRDFYTKYTNAEASVTLPAIHRKYI